MRRMSYLAVVLLLGACSPGDVAENTPDRANNPEPATVDQPMEHSGHNDQEKPVKQEGKENRLAKEKSPYLLQHARNPVDWYPWGKEAFDKAKKEGKLIFLSIGYSTCHWCHVMERESFENEDIAKVMNENFVCVKVDREERPDIDQIYMSFVTSTQGSGGWPLSVWLTPDRKPFVGGTYFPPEDKFGRKGFKSVLLFLAKEWKEKKDAIVQQAEQYTQWLERNGNPVAKGEVGIKTVEEALDNFDRFFDDDNGGWGSAPKFPQPSLGSFLLRHHARTGNKRGLEIVETQLRAMAKGGIYDHLGGGFARYSTDARWLVPHFEKMLYDNAQLLRLYAETHRIKPDDEYERVMRETADYVLRDMTDRKGGFFSAEDADSEGVEGKFYVWKKSEIVDLIGEDDTKILGLAYDVTEKGNWEDPHHDMSGLNILNRVKTDAEVAKELEISESKVRQILKRSKEKLFEVREKRIRPGLDDKVLTSWNGLMIGALAYVGATLDEPKYVRAARRAAEFIRKTLVVDDKLLHRYRDGEAGLKGLLEDYAYLVAGLLDLYEVSLETKWLALAKDLNRTMIALFEDKENGGFFTAQADQKDLIIRTKDTHDGALPSPNNVAVLNLIRLGELTSDDKLKELADKTLGSMGRSISQNPAAYPLLLVAVDWLAGPSRQIVLAGEPKEFQAILSKRFLSRTVLVHSSVDPKIVPMVEGKKATDEKPTAYVCRNYTCNLPTSDMKEFEKQLKEGE